MNSDTLASIHAIRAQLCEYGELLKEALAHIKAQNDEIKLLEAALALACAQRDKLRQLHSLKAVDVYERPN